MAYLKPQAFTRHVVNPLVSRLQTGGVATLTVPGRRTGRAHTVPVIPVEAGGIRYLVSPYGETQWVRNLRAAGQATLTRKGKVETFQASEVTVPGRAAIIGAYRKVCGRTVDPCFTKLPDPSDHPVFRLDEIGASSRA
jgi:deazaflavin-dependent oxidoreductase (nitroreductase family)